MILRQKFSRIRSLGERQELLAVYRLLFQPIDVPESIHDCRDPKDDKFLELALAGRADFLITGDADLLAPLARDRDPESGGLPRALGVSCVSPQCRLP